MSDLLELAARVEAATGWDQELDRDIAQYVNDSLPEGSVRWQWKTSHISLPRYTSSIDAAKTLVPEGWFWTVGFDNAGIYSQVAEPMPDHDEHRIATIFVQATIPALALAAAALRARASA